MGTRSRRCSAMLCVLALGFIGAGMTGACGSSEPSEADLLAEVPLAIKGTRPPGKRVSFGPNVPDRSEAIRCSDGVKDTACTLYRIPLLGNPHEDVALRNKYKAAFGSACYMSEGQSATFNCFYKKWEKACADAALIAQVYGAAPYDKGYTCQAVGNGDYTLQVGSDPANKIDIKYENAPLETSLIDVDGVPTAVSGPYRDLPEPSTVKVGGRFNCYYIDGVVQSERILQVNRNNNGGKIRSDLAGYVHPCTTGMCTEPTFLEDPAKPKKDIVDPALLPQVHHEVRKTDLRGCDWGTNSNKNAAVISRRLNQHLYNKYPTKEEVEKINAVPPYTP